MNLSLRISNEIWMLILSSGLQLEDLRASSLACRHFRDVAQPLLFVNASLDVGGVLMNSDQRKLMWYTPSNASEINIRERLFFITSPRIAPFVETLRIGYEWVVSEEDNSIRPEQGTGLLDEAISYLPRFTSLKRLVIRWSPITPLSLQGLRHPSISQARIRFYECVPIEGINEPILGSHKGEVVIVGSEHLNISITPLFRALWTQSLTRLSIWKIPTSTIYEEALKSWGKLEALRALAVDDESLAAILPYSGLFPNIDTIRIREDINPSSISIDIPSTSFPKLEVLDCSLRHLWQFMGRPIRKLDLFMKRSWLREYDPAEVGAEIKRNKPILSRLSELNVKAITSEGHVFEEMISSCSGLLSLKIDVYQPHGRSDKRPSELKLKEFLDRLRGINWPLNLKVLRIETPNNWEDAPENRHIRERLFLEALNSLNMLDFPTRLREVTFVTGLLRVIYYECQSFAYVTHDGSVGKWSLYEIYKEAQYELY